MKLRNKQTRKVYTVRKDIFVSIIDTGKIEVRVMTPDGHVSFFYSSFNEMLNDWEDYKPAEPYIKDEEIRKFVRDWAAFNKIEEAFIQKPFNSDSWYYVQGNDETKCAWKIEIHASYSETIRKDYDERMVAITDLCGEEE